MVSTCTLKSSNSNILAAEACNKSLKQFLTEKITFHVGWQLINLLFRVWFQGAYAFHRLVALYVFSE